MAPSRQSMAPMRFNTCSSWRAAGWAGPRWNGWFFSSRRRHTGWTGDWSSDVCSSDLSTRTIHRLDRRRPHPRLADHRGIVRVEYRLRHPGSDSRWAAQIGRASCRERALIVVGDGAVKAEYGTYAVQYVLILAGGRLGWATLEWVVFFKQKTAYGMDG